MSSKWKLSIVRCILHSGCKIQRRGELESWKKSLFEEGALELRLGGRWIFGKEGRIILVMKLKYIL